VVVGAADPHERGRGLRELKAARIAVSAGVLAAEAREQNREYFTRLRTRRPFVTLKLATTLDGRIADSRGHSKWITSGAARAWTRGMRSRVDAILVGSGTALADDPRLTAPGAGAGPLKVVVDARARLSPRARVFDRGRVLVATGPGAPGSRTGALRLAGAEVVACPQRGGRLDLRRLMGALHARGIGSILCEGGGELAGSLVASRLVDRVVMVMSPRLLGGRGSVAAVGGPDRPLSRAFALKRVERFRIGPDTVVTGLAN
jgi:diaminohydroxyphosphoribosylaminopyrimidine deaminase/5-amino-6-(5-phosphoribosylamino)uracil reductase